MYKVKGWFPNYGCSRYQGEDGDAICWVYTCDLGADVGDNSTTGTGNSAVRWQKLPNLRSCSWNLL